MRKKTFFFRFLFQFLIITLFSFCLVNVGGSINQTNITVKDDYLQASMVMDKINIIEANQMQDSIKVNPNIGVYSEIDYIVVGEQKVDLIELRTVFILSNYDFFSRTMKIDMTLNPKENCTFVQGWKFNNYVGSKNLALVSGIYRLRYDLTYSVQGSEYVLKGSPFFIEFDANPSSSIFGIVSSIAFLVTGYSLIKHFVSFRDSLKTELANSIEASKISPSVKFMGFYKGKSFKQIQNQLTSIFFNNAKNLWRGEKCPKCTSPWQKDSDMCSECFITKEEANVYYSKSVVEKSLQASEKIVNSVSVLDIKNIIGSISLGIIPIEDIVYVLSSSGLTLVEPKISKSLTKKQRKLIFTGLQTALSSLFWIQVTGLSVVSVSLLIIALSSGFVLPIIITKILELNIKNRVKLLFSIDKSITHF